MRIAMPTENGMVYQHFGKTPEFTIYEVESELIKNKEFVSTEGSEHEALADFLTVQSVNVVISGNIGSSVKNALREKRIELIPGVVGSADDMIVKYLSGEKMGNPDTEYTHQQEENHECSDDSHQYSHH